MDALAVVRSSAPALGGCRRAILLVEVGSGRVDHGRAPGAHRVPVEVALPHGRIPEVELAAVGLVGRKVHRGTLSGISRLGPGPTGIILAPPFIDTSSTCALSGTVSRSPPGFRSRATDLAQPLTPLRTDACSLLPQPNLTNHPPPPASRAISATRPPNSSRSRASTASRRTASPLERFPFPVMIRRTGCPPRRVQLSSRWSTRRSACSRLSPWRSISASGYAEWRESRISDWRGREVRRFPTDRDGPGQPSVGSASSSSGIGGSSARRPAR